MAYSQSRIPTAVIEAYEVDADFGGDGLTVDDLVVLTGYDTNQVAPPVHFLFKGGVLKKVGRGKTRKGCTANRWALTDTALEWEPS